MRTTAKRVLAGVAAVSASLTALPVLASPAGAATDNGGFTLNPESGNSDTAFSVNLPVGAKCPGDSATDGYFIQSFMVPSSVDLNTLTFGGSGPIQQGSEFMVPLFDINGSPLVNGFTDITTGNILPFPNQFSYAVFEAPGVVPDGDYDIGIACTQGAPGPTQLKTFWSETVSITGVASGGGTAGLTWEKFVEQTPEAPGAPAITTVTPGDSSLTVAFTAPTVGYPTAFTYDLTATPQGGGTPVTVNGAPGSPINVGGLANGTTYDLSLTATNSEGTGPAATSVGTPGVAVPAPSVSITPTIEGLDYTFTPNAAAPSGTTYTVTISPDTTPSYSEVFAAAPFGDSLTGLTPGTPYTVTVTPTYPVGYSGPAGTATAAPIASGTLQQTIVGTRPAGELKITQDCGADPTCTVDLGTGVLDGYSQYYVATGAMYPVTVTDTRDTDGGWTVLADLDDEFLGDSNGDSFSGQALGWAPRPLSFITPPGGGYTMVASEGPAIAPWTSSALVDGTAVLMKSGTPTATTGGLGMATTTADLTLAIPVSAAADTYRAVMTISVTSP